MKITPNNEDLNTVSPVINLAGLFLCPDSRIILTSDALVKAEGERVIKECYGTKEVLKNMPECEVCSMREFCADALASIPPAIGLHETGSTCPIETKTKEQHASEQKEPDEQDHLCGLDLCVVLAQLLESVGHNPKRLYDVVARMAGLSMEEIGQATGRTRAAVKEQLHNVARNNPVLSQYLRERPVSKRGVLVEAIKPEQLEIDFDKQIKEILKG